MPHSPFGAMHSGRSTDTDPATRITSASQTTSHSTTFSCGPDWKGSRWRFLLRTLSLPTRLSAHITKRSSLPPSSFCRASRITIFTRPSLFPSRSSQPRIQAARGGIGSHRNTATRRPRYSRRLHQDYKLAKESRNRETLNWANYAASYPPRNHAPRLSPLKDQLVARLCPKAARGEGLRAGRQRAWGKCNAQTGAEQLPIWRDIVLCHSARRPRAD